MSRRRIAMTEEGGRDQSDALYVTALARGMAVLSAFSPARPELTVREISEACELPYPTAWRLCFTLEQCGYLMTIPESGKVCLSARVLTLGHAALSRYPVADVIYPQMQAITKRHKVGLSLGTRVGTEMVYLRRTYSRFVAFNRTSLPIFDAPTGWAYLAACDTPFRAELLERLRVAYPAGWKAFKSKFEQALPGYGKDGYLIIHEIGPTPSDCVAVPIRSGGSGEILGLSAAGLSRQLTESKLRVLGEELLEISRMMAPVHA